MLQPLPVQQFNPETTFAHGTPYWEEAFAPEDHVYFESFPTFMALVWDHIGLPVPTDAQDQVAHRLQYGADSYEWAGLSDASKALLATVPREDIIRAYRGVGKSYITAAYVLWRLMRNPRDEKVLVISATGAKAKKFVSQIKGVGQSLKLTEWLFEGDREMGVTRRDEADQFDVTGASISQDFSVVARGITGQITGNRATCIVPDDIEIEQNSRTEDARIRILEITREFDAIAKTEHGKGDVIFLGTPQTEESVYNVLVKERGFECFTVPIRFPEQDKLKAYELERADGERRSIIAPYLLALHAAGKLRSGDLTDPARFTSEELIAQEAKGRAYFALQYMLDTSLSDADRYPLRTSDLIVMSLNDFKAPITLQWGRDSSGKNTLTQFRNIGFAGDKFYGPLFMDNDWAEYEGRVMFVDPAGRGKDEITWAIVSSLHGMLYLHKLGSHLGDPAVGMKNICLDAKAFNVSVIDVEPNMGGGMFTVALGPVLAEVWPGGCTLQDSEWVSTMKEARIIDTLEPVLTQHRLVVDQGVIQKDLDDALKSEDSKSYSLLYQLTHIARERGCLKHDDRLDALAGAVAYWMRTVAVSQKQAAQGHRDDLMQQEIDQFLECFSGETNLERGWSRGKRPDEIVMQTRVQHQ